MSAGTSFDEIYELFLTQVDDYDLVQIEKEERDEVLQGYLISATKELFNYEENDFTDFDLESHQFNFELSGLEKQIMALGMKLTWTQLKKTSAELYQPAYGDRDFTVVQGTSYLKEINNQVVGLQSEIRRLIYQSEYNEPDHFGTMLNG